MAESPMEVVEDVGGEACASASSVDTVMEDMTSKDYYFDSYARHNIHEEMLKDEVRTLTYRDAMYRNRRFFSGKVVMDVGCGTGILSMFAAKAGAKQVYAIECSKIVHNAMEIIRDNKLDHIIKVIEGKVEDISLPAGVDKVDVIVSEWMGYCLLYESMLETVIYARNKFLKPGGYIFPDRCGLFITGVDNRDCKEEIIEFWDDVYGFDMSIIGKMAIMEPVIEKVPRDQMVTNSVKLRDIDLYSIQKEDIDATSMFQLQATRNDYVHALAAHFTVEFSMCNPKLGFTTAPGSPYTHWKQTVFYLDGSIPIKKGEVICGKFDLKRNTSNNRDLDITIDVNFKGALAEFNDKGSYKMH